MEIIFEGIILRPWSIDDAENLADIANNKKLADNLRDLFPYPYSVKDARDWIKSILSFEPVCNFAVICKDEVAGNIGIVTKDDVHRKNVEIGYFLSEKFWGQGIAARAIKAITSYAFNDFDIVRVYAETFADNLQSRRALEKAGFRLEATLKNYVFKNGVLKDGCIYSVLKEDFRYFLAAD